MFSECSTVEILRNFFHFGWGGNLEVLWMDQGGEDSVAHIPVLRITVICCLNIDGPRALRGLTGFRL